MTITIFVSYSHKDDTFREQLNKHLAPLSREQDIEFWFDGDILAGDALDPEIRRAFKRSSIFLALGSHNYLSSEYCFRKEYTPALARAGRKTMRVIVALVGTCDWKHTRMAHYKSLPKDGKPVDQWGNRNKAYLDIVEGLRKVISAVRKERKALEEATKSSKQKPRSASKPSHIAAVSPKEATRKKVTGASKTRLAKKLKKPRNKTSVTPIKRRVPRKQTK